MEYTTLTENLFGFIQNNYCGFTVDFSTSFNITDSYLINRINIRHMYLLYLLRECR